MVPRSERTIRSGQAGPRNDRVSSRDRVLFGLTRERVAVSSLPEDKRRSIDDRSIIRARSNFRNERLG